MDAALLEKDLVSALSSLPKDFVRDAAKVMLSHDVGALFPQVMSKLGPHIRALVFEVAMGQLDTAELESVVKRAVSALGVEFPDAAKT